MQLRVHKTDPVTKETTPITCTVSGDKFRLLLRGKNSRRVRVVRMKRSLLQRG